MSKYLIGTKIGKIPTYRTKIKKNEFIETKNIFKPFINSKNKQLRGGDVDHGQQSSCYLLGL